MIPNNIAKALIRIFVFTLIFVLGAVTGQLLRGAIRLTDDPKPKEYFLRVKDVQRGTISFKEEIGDNTHEVGDLFLEADSVGSYPNGRVIVANTYVVLTKKQIR